MIYIQQTNQKNNILQKINRVHIHKKILLPFELVSIDGGTPTNCYYNESECSSVE